MKRVLFLSDKHTNDVKKQLEFMYGFRPDDTVHATNVRQITQDVMSEGTLVHLHQPPLTMTSNTTSDKFLEVMARPPYNLHNPWLKQFDRILVTYYDVSKQERFIQTVV